MASPTVRSNNVHLNKENPMRSTSLFRAGSGRVLAAPLVALVLLVSIPACAQQNEAEVADAAAANQAADDTVVGRVMGQPITMAELETGAADQLQGVEAQLLQCERQAEQNRHQVLQSALEAEIRNRLVAAEAAEAGQTPQEYLAAELESKLAPVTDEDVQAFYAENQARIGNRPIEQVGPQIRQYLEQQNRAQAEQVFFDALAEKHEVAFLLEPPRTQVAAEGPSHGPVDAPVTIVEFSDFECPFCSRVLPALEQVKANYGDKVRLVFRQFPLNIHPNAQKAAEASLCAADQDKFWEMHDLMFAEQRQLSVADLKAKAQRLELDTAAFDQCLDSGRHAGQVQADLAAGVEAGVSGTPAMFINGIPVSGAVPYENLAELIDAELERKGVATN
jgi:predicted DsbA family dithiol-disulfide isomerase